jgi:SHAQKYF class myb-like DNA-binding protein
MNKTLNKDNKSLSLSERDNLQKPKKKIFSIISGNDNSFLKKKKFDVTYTKDKKNKEKYNIYGYWDKSEHKKFIDALYLYNCEWLKIQKYLKNRSYMQIRSHAQKFYLKLKSFKDEKLELDFTPSNVNSLNDIIKIVREKERISKNSEKLLYIISEKLSFGKSVHKQEEDIIINIKEEEQEDYLDNCDCKNKINKTQNDINFIDNSNYNDSYNIIDNNNRIYFEKFELKKKEVLDFINRDNIVSTNNDSEEDLESIFPINDNSINDLIFLQKFTIYKDIFS